MTVFNDNFYYNASFIKLNILKSFILHSDIIIFSNYPTVGCGQDLVSGKHGVPDSALTASSSYDIKSSPSRARLYITANDFKDGAWSPSVADDQWIQVFFKCVVLSAYNNSSSLMPNGKSEQ